LIFISLFLFEKDSPEYSRIMVSCLQRLKREPAWMDTVYCSPKAAILWINPGGATYDVVLIVITN